MQDATRFIGTHFFIPAQVNRLLEVIPATVTTPETLATIMALALDLGKHAVIAPNGDGFIGNRLFDRFHQEAMYLVEEGAQPEEVDAALEGWGRTLELRGFESEGHTERVADMAHQLGHALGMSDAELVHVRRGAVLHDIGKMGIPDDILLKPGPLNDGEWVIMRQHPVYAYEMLSPVAYLRPALDIPYCHHERWDGSGYPRGLKGEQIPLAARIFAVVDVWDALLSDRPYRPAWSEERVIEYLRDEAEKHFDPQVLGAFLGMTDAQE